MTTAEDILNIIFGKEHVNGYSSVKLNNGTGSSCSTCKNYDGGICKKGYAFAGVTNIKLGDCNNWEVCNE